MAAVSKGSGNLAHAAHAALYSPLTSNSLQTHSSLNSALESASSVAAGLHSVAESLHSEGGEGGASQIQEREEEDEENPSHFNENGWKRGQDGTTVSGSNERHIHGGIERLSTRLSTGPPVAMEGLSEGDEAASSSNCEPFEADELQLIEDALRSLRSLDEGQIEGSKALKNNLLSSSDLQDLEEVARLLKKVQAVKAWKEGAPSKLTTSSKDMYMGEKMEPADIRQVVQAAAQTALAAAKTAETVVSSLNRNSQAMEDLCKALTRPSSLRGPEDEEVLKEEEEEDQQSKYLAIELQQTEIAKSLVRQNRMTHWVLGFIVVSSLLWRYGVIKFVKKVNNTIQNPFQGITDMFKPKKHNDKEHSGPQFKLPPIMGGDEDARQQKHHAGKEKEDNMFDIGSIFPGQEPKEKEGEDRPFNLSNIGNMLPGHNSDSE